MQGWHGPLARPAGLPARLSGAGRTGGNGLRMQKKRLTRSVRRVAGRYGPVARATFVCNRSLMPDYRAPLGRAAGPFDFVAHFGFRVKLTLTVCWILLTTSLAWASEPVQLPYARVSDADLGLPADLTQRPASPALPGEIVGRRIPDVTLFSELATAPLTHRAIPLPSANTLAHVNYLQRRFGRVQTSAGRMAFFNPETILVKFRGQMHVSALRVEPGRELAAVRLLGTRPDVEFAELDTFERRQFAPDDPMLDLQWHHGVIGSAQAWGYSLGQPSVQVAIVDTPFQMDHPDLAANTVAGWDVVANAPVTASAGISHSTLCAGMAAAVINNGVGVAGAANCQILPINIDGSISDMYNATIWAANHGVRVVSISWSGGTSSTLESAGAYLKTNAAGLLIMSAVDGSGPLTGPNQPDVWCISMTDAADNFQGTQYGAYIDFSAPGYQIYSTSTGGAYAAATGCSYAAPLFAGVVAWLMAFNPTLGPDDLINLLQTTATPLGPPGWNPYYGWGRVNFGAAAAAAAATLPAISGIQWSNRQVVVTANYYSNGAYSLWRTPQLAPASWSLVTNALLATNGTAITLTDPTPSGQGAFYRIQAASR